MNCTDLKEHLMPFADGELEPTLASEVEKALESCPECQEELAEIRRISSMSRMAFMAPVEAVNLAGVYDGVMARIAAEANATEVAAAKAPAATTAPGAWARFTQWCSELVRFEHPMALAGAAAAVLAVVVGLSMTGGDKAQTVGAPEGVASSEPRRRGAEEEVKAMGRNGAFVEHLEAQKGKAFVEFDKNDPEAPMVLWHVVEEDGVPAPKGL